MSTIGPARAEAEPIAQTVYGKVRGAMADGVYAFKGVRYGAPTGGDNRFMPPRKPQPWADVQDALAFGNMAPQSNPDPQPSGPSQMILGQLPHDPAAPPPPPRPKESEDCLFLNVWTAGLNDGVKRPVMVWLHGGFFSAGSGATNGANLAQRGDVVVVSVNHRLNVLGYSHFGDLGGPEWAHSGNAGMMDIVAALEWVRDNIERFGGDPSRVMAFGESGGGMKTSFLMASPAARGLIHRASVISGPGLAFMTREAATKVSQMLLDELKLTPAQLGELQRLPLEQLQRARYAVQAKFPAVNFTDLASFAPVLDPQLLPRQPFTPDAAPQTRDIPLLIGSAQTDMIFFMGNDEPAFHLDRAGLVARARSLFGDKGEDVVKVYETSYKDYSPSDLYAVMFSDFSIMDATVQQAERKAALGGAPVFLYQFDWRSPALGGKLKSLHTLDSSFIFDTVDDSRPLTGGGPDAHALARKMSDAWAHFAIAGDPNAPNSGLPHWPAYTAPSRATMLFDNVCEVKDDPFRAERQAIARAEGRGQ